VTATWAPGDPVYRREDEGAVCADSTCGTAWSAAEDIDECPACGGPPKDQRSDRPR
jgi:rubredoxin